MVILLIVQSKDSAWINVRQTKFETALTIKRSSLPINYPPNLLRQYYIYIYIKNFHESSVINACKISPITGPRCPEGSRKLSFPDYVKTAQDGGKIVSLKHRPLLGNTPGTHFC